MIGSLLISWALGKDVQDGCWENVGGDYDLSEPVESFVDTVRQVVLQPMGLFAGLPGAEAS